MRIRRKKWAEEELSSSPIYLDGKQELKGTWQEKVSNLKNEDFELIIEIGMGKGKFISNLAHNNLEKKNTIYVGIDMIEAMLGLAKREIEEVYLNISKEDREKLNNYSNRLNYYRKFKNAEEVEKLENELKNNAEIKEIYTNILEKTKIKSNFPNIYILNTSAEQITRHFEAKDNVSRVYLNFSNPWPKDKHNKRRLTYMDKLEAYMSFLKEDGLILFKTDDLPFFNDSLEYFEKANLKVIAKTNDLEKEDIYFEVLGEKNIETEHEKMFKDQGIKINAVILKKK